MSAPEGGHVLVIGVDGVRFDFLGPDSAPSIWALGQAGFLAQVPVDEATPTWSGPCWATIATGTGVAGHGITGNDLTGHRLAEHPDFVTRATRAGLPTLLAVSGWPPLALAEDGGPLFAEASTRIHRRAAGRPAWDAAREASREEGLTAWDAADEAITARAAAILAGQAPRVSFVYLGPSTSPGTPPAPEPPTGRPCWLLISGSGGWWRRCAPAVRPKRTGRSWWSPTTGTWTKADTAGASPRSRPRGRLRLDLGSGRALRRWSRGRRRWRRWFWPQQAAQSIRVSAQARTTPTPTAAPPTASLKVCAPMATMAAATAVAIRTARSASSTAKLAASAKLLVACPLGKAAPMASPTVGLST